MSTPNHSKRAVISLLIALPTSGVISLAIAFYAAWVTYGAGKPPGIAVVLLPFLFVWSKCSDLFGNGSLAFAAGCAAQVIVFYVIVFGALELRARVDLWRQRSDD